MACLYQRRAAARYSASGCMSRLSEYAARPVNVVSARRPCRLRAARVWSAIRSRPARVSGPSSWSRDSSTRSRPRSLATMAAQSSGRGQRLTAKQLLTPSLARISAHLRSGQGQVAAVHVVVERAVAGVRLGDRAGAIRRRDRLGDIVVDAGAQAGQHRGPGRGGVAGDADDGGARDVGLDLVPERDPRAAARYPQLGGRPGGALQDVEPGPDAERDALQRGPG